MSIVKTVSPAPPQEAEASPIRLGMIVSARFSVSGFARQWAHCHLLANYLGRYVSANEGDPERHATMLSTFVNELLEIVYRNHAGDGQIELTFRKKNGRVLLQATVPISESQRMFYRMAVQLVGQPDLKTWYRARLEDPAEGEDTMLGLLELVAVYGCNVAMTENAGESRVTLSLHLPEFDDMGEV
ncbi:hypothetical protein [Polyangium aurulentum]|uniref:hypothetical protein n=1 Tax=Polyangium aurulentum TaxID=2567896 RepID=UPI001F397E65|nr:hypothetical protein [Polyangium aurulentum]